ncbi:hypothetical protein AB1N83_006066 [Pleurotus pulmonarius]
MIPVLAGEQSTGLVSEPTRLSTGNGRGPVCASGRSLIRPRRELTWSLITSCSVQPTPRFQRHQAITQLSFILGHEQISDISKRPIHFRRFFEGSAGTFSQEKVFYHPEAGGSYYPPSSKYFYTPPHLLKRVKSCELSYLVADFLLFCSRHSTQALRSTASSKHGFSDYGSTPPSAQSSEPGWKSARYISDPGRLPLMIVAPSRTEFNEGFRCLMSGVLQVSMHHQIRRPSADLEYHTLDPTKRSV